MARGKVLGSPKRSKHTVETLSIRTELRGCMVGTEANDEGGKTLVVAHASGHEWAIPMNRQQNFELANLLIDGGLEIASEVPEET